VVHSEISIKQKAYFLVVIFFLQFLGDTLSEAKMNIHGRKGVSRTLTAFPREGDS
jgi:hypothetical protein